MENMEKSKFKCEMIWKIQKKSMLNSEKIWRLWKKGKSNSENMYNMEEKEGTKHLYFQNNNKDVFALDR